jgi:hypothetical protein
MVLMIRGLARLHAGTSEASRMGAPIRDWLRLNRVCYCFSRSGFAAFHSSIAAITSAGSKSFAAS